MPAYGVDRYISFALDSVLAQTFTSYEIIVVNDGCPRTKELERVLAPYRERVIYIKQQNQGASAARNTAIREARGRYLALLDPDDYWEPEYLSVQVGVLETQPAIDVLYPNARLIGDTFNAGKTYMDLSPSKGEVTFETLITEQCQVPIFVTARTEVVKQAGMFDESIRISQDFDLWIRIVKQGGRITYTRQVLVNRRRRPEGLSSNEVALCRDILIIFDKVARTFSLTPSESGVLKHERAKRQAMLELCQGKEAFLKGNAKTAINHLVAANAFLKSRKIALVLAGLRTAPRFLLRCHRMRERLRWMGVRDFEAPMMMMSRSG